MKFMKTAIELAKLVATDIPVAAVIVKDGKIISQAVNKKELENDVTSHAEILALKDAAKTLNNWRLDGCEIYVTLEPCPMCAWAILQSRIKTVYFGSFDKKYGAFGSAIDLSKYSDNKPKIYSGIMEEECDNILEEFWKTKRNK